MLFWFSFAFSFRCGVVAVPAVLVVSLVLLLSIVWSLFLVSVTFLGVLDVFFFCEST